ncbi:hypothetical protein, partial [Photobacterium sanctipauli]
INTLYLANDDISIETSGIKPVIPDFDNTSGNKSFEPFAEKIFFNFYPNNMENEGNLSISQGNDVELHINYDTGLGLYSLIVSSEDYQGFSNNDQDAQFYAKSMDLDTEFDLDPYCQLNLANTVSERNENCTDLNTSTFNIKFLDLIDESTTIYILGNDGTEKTDEVWSRYPGEEWKKLGVLDGTPVTLDPALNTCVWDGTVCKVQEFILKNPTIDKYTVEVDKGNNEALCQFTSGVLKDGACVSLDTAPAEYSTKVDVESDDVSETTVVYAIGASVDKYHRKYSKYEFDLECLAEQTSTLTFTPEPESDLVVETDFEISKFQGEKCYHRKNKNDGSHETELLIEIDLKSNQ